MWGRAVSGTDLATVELADTARMDHLDGLRGLAALWVVFSHAGPGRLEAVLPGPLNAVFAWGRLGVAVFFGLSGFVIAHSIRTARVDGRFAGRFLVRRAVRLTPPYYFSLLAVLAVTATSTLIEGEPFESEGPITLGRLLAHLFYLQHAFGMKDLSPMYWTLAFEMWFYLTFIGLMWLEQRWSRGGSGTAHRLDGVPLAAAACLSLPFAFGVDEVVHLPSVVQYFGLFYAFVGGVIAFRSRSGRLHPAWSFGFSGAVLAGGAIQRDGFAVTAGLTALGMTIGLGPVEALLGRRVPQFLGRISYSLYLIHPPILGAIGFVGDRYVARGASGDVVEVVVGIGVSIVAGLIMWRIVEVPSIARSRALAAGRHPATNTKAAPAV